MNSISEVGGGVYRVDTGYHRPLFDAAYLIVEDGAAAFVDCGANHSVPRLMEALERHGLQPPDVKWLMLTHIHLDHAGGAGRLLVECPEAQLLVHPRGVRHMSDPSRLEAGVRAVYGDAAYDELYGSLLPVNADRITAAEDGLSVDLKGREIQVMDTPGHARHHVCFLDETSASVFTGDTMGVAYPELTVDNEPFVFPPSSPVDFDAEAWHGSVEKLGHSGMKNFCLTHYGCVANTRRMIEDMHRRIDRFAALALQTPPESLKPKLAEYLLDEVKKHGCRLPDEEILSILALDIDLCAQGLIVWRDRLHPNH